MARAPNAADARQHRARLKALRGHAALLDDAYVRMKGMLPVLVDRERVLARIAGQRDERPFPHPEAFRAQMERATADPAYQALAVRARAAREAIYTDRFHEAAARLREGNPADIEEALLFLEVDPFYFCSGYQKQQVYRDLRHVSEPGPAEASPERTYNGHPSGPAVGIP